MSKPGAERFPSDDFTVIVNGATYHPHEGEWVELFPDQSVAEILSHNALTRLGAKLKTVQGDPDEQVQVATAISEHFDTVCHQLAARVMAWTWTDRRGNPLPQPDGTIGPIASLSSEEMAYLLRLRSIRQETEAERKNG